MGQEELLTSSSSIPSSGSSSANTIPAAVVVPSKRKGYPDGADGLLNEAGPHEAHRAYIAHAAPHLLGGSPASSPSQSSPDSPSPRGLSGRPPQGSPSTSARPSPSPSEEDRERSTSRSASSPVYHGAAQLHGELSRQRSHHVVPKRYRGPLPMLGDAEDVAPLPPLVPFASGLFNVVNYPFNRNGWRYVGAGPASQALPQTVYRTLETEPSGVHWSWADRSTFTHLSQDATVISATNGFRSARANVPVREGSWYAEIHILEPDGPATNAKDGNHVRLGWGRREAGLNAPVGFNGYSYGMRDATGEKVFLSRTYPYGREFKPGDVVGMWITLPPARQADPEDPLDTARVERKRLPIRYKGRLYFEQLEYAATKEMDHLMDRSRRGEKLAGSRGPPNGEMAVNASTGMLAAPKRGEECVNGQKKRKGAGLPPGSAPTKNTSANLRAIPTLGPDSQIGFLINGEPQGIAFENLFDFRPLRKQKVGQSGSLIKSKAASARGLGASDDGNEENNIITANSTAASILKSRENHFDDGALGYFPFVSLYGNAKARIVVSADQFRFPPPQDVRRALEDADRKRGRYFSADVFSVSTDPAKGVGWRALGERYGEFLEELWRYDLADEEKAQEVARRAAEEESSDEESVDTLATASVPRTTGKKPKKKPSAVARRAGSSTPIHSPAHASPSSQENLKVDEDSEGDLSITHVNPRYASSTIASPAIEEHTTMELHPERVRYTNTMANGTTSESVVQAEQKLAVEAMQIDNQDPNH